MRIIYPQPGSKMLIAAPAKPMPKEISDALMRMAENYSDILEAHLPYCFIPDIMKEPSQILVLILKSGFCLDPIVKSIGVRLTDILPLPGELLLMPIDETNQLCKPVRNARCKIYSKPTVEK
jgi:hypothetical protein